MRNTALKVLVAAAIVTAVTVVWGVARAHNGYELLKRTDGQTCCDGRECQKAAWRVHKGVLEVFVEFEGVTTGWYPVPPESIIHTQKAPEGTSYMCWWQNRVHCFGYGTLF